MEMRKPVNQTNAWKRLQEIRGNLTPNLREWFMTDANRGECFSVTTKHIIFDFSRQIITEGVLDGLLDLAEGTDLKGNIGRMFSGEKINVSEGRAVLHTALRNPPANPVYVDGCDVMPKVKEVLAKIEDFSQKVIAGEWKGYTGKRLRNIVSIGIGGSYLGPEYLAEACKPFAVEGMNLCFVANVDPTDFARKTQGLNPEETLVVVVSKTFTTAETMANAGAAKVWMKKALGNNDEVIKKHFVAVSSNEEKAQKEVEKFGIPPENRFVIWDWVGGRYSATSAVGGVPLSLYLGYNNFEKILKGAYWMDQHFYTEPFENNIPVLAGLIDLWNINFMGYQTRAIVPYSQAWHRYAAHCQQTEMESNGKSVDLFGRSVEFDTGEIVFGEPGTNSQHSYFQLLHQGTNIVPTDFIGFLNPPKYDRAEGEIEIHKELHEELMTNFFAQPDALAFGKSNRFRHKRFSGNRPSNIFLLENQDPFSTGMLLALLEHRVAVKGFIWNINSFDQFGVELGKELGGDIRKRMKRYKSCPSDPAIFEGLNSSTSKLLRTFLQRKSASQGNSGLV
ncbi:glucose-6-phosphate isomerase [Candidatus Poribacteria bacterium]|nr:glucose-6-phosphate isomerase [Candidatus Poribacteria bacterium]